MSIGAFSIDQLMELAGLSVSQAGVFYIYPVWLQQYLMTIAVYRVHPPSRGRKILVACGPGNNGELT
jgi:NAD(P)H-hydrate epimerase